MLGVLGEEPILASFFRLRLDFRLLPMPVRHSPP